MTSPLHADRTHPTTTGPRPRPRRPGLGALAAVAVGGALGTLARYGLVQLASIPASGFPWVTLGINASGGLALGVLLVLILERFPPSRYLRPFAATGFLGAYTTYSTFAVETVMLSRDGHPATAAGYMAASLAAGLGAAWVGITAGRTISRSTGGRP